MDETEDQAGRIAVLDIGKTNVKLSAVTPGGTVLETLSHPNVAQAGLPWQHPDLAGLGLWVLDSLAILGRRHPLHRIVPTGHGSGGVLVGEEPGAGDGGVLPMIDYEQALPDSLNAAYLPLAGEFFDRGSALMMAATHLARQMFWMQTTCPAAFSTARWYLGLPQYWAWWLSGVAVSEVSYLGAQSHLWNVRERHWSPIVARQGWGRLMPPVVPAWADLGPVRADLMQRHGLPEGLRVHAGIHDSTANFYRYQAAGLTDIAVVSTGTWIVALADRIDLDRLDEARGMTCNSDVRGAALGGALNMGGRDYAALASAQPPGALADPAVLARLVARGTMALPSFGADDGQFRGSAEQGRILGPAPEGAEERLALAGLYLALLTVACIGALDSARRVVLDGSFLRDPAYAALVAALRPGAETLVSPETYGVAAGAGLLCGHASRTDPAPITLRDADALALPGLAAYAAQWSVQAGKAQSFTDDKGPDR